jgi:septal ring factor EnvC (AmiA/AmiB activator)
MSSLGALDDSEPAGPGPRHRPALLPFVGRSALLCLFIMFLIPAGLPSQQDQSDLEQRLSKINEEIKALREKISAEEKKESTLLSQLDKIALTKRLIQNELESRNLQMEKTSREIAIIRGNISDLRLKLQAGQRAVEKTLVTLYKYGRFDFLQFLLDAGNVSALFSESRHLGLLASYQQGTIAAYLRTMADLRSEEAALAAKRDDWARLVQESGQKKQELEAQEAASRALVRQIQDNKKSFERALDEQKERAEHLQTLMSKLANQELVLPFRFVPFYERKGKLAWPIDGKVITRFGLERHRQFNTIIMNNGIEIAPSDKNAAIKALHAGKVVYADDFQGYGNLIIIDHGMNYYTLYGHCAEFLVAKGDFVREEQPIASVGDSGSLKGQCLYLEIRYRAKPLDPLQWLRRR